MDLSDKVLPGDLKVAIDLFKCASDSLERSLLESKLGNADLSTYWAKESIKCSNDLMELYLNKERHEQMKELAKRLKQHGMNFEMLSAEVTKNDH